MASVYPEVLDLTSETKSMQLRLDNRGRGPLLFRVRSVNVTAYMINPMYYYIPGEDSRTVTITIIKQRHVDALHDSFKVSTLPLTQSYVEKNKLNGMRALKDADLRACWEDVISLYNTPVRDIIVPVRSVGVLGTFQAKLDHDVEDLNALKRELEELLARRKANAALIRDMEGRGILLQMRRNQLDEQLRQLHERYEMLKGRRIEQNGHIPYRLLFHCTSLILVTLGCAMVGYRRL
ncbi:hypothetical protein GMRT_16331 [Giardia muris]|uniref:MSP domain-containing protein n=1 Tax=Giardia muris TaxID=5742 RepID=A0A4Z1T959_GIAMU|nr:hypothetical protein GMRT_16331 [Giardia muris]|eukprot:TNJ29677.1 hypothetical protein GMRT_16331 [Giardia muris]